MEVIHLLPDKVANQIAAGEVIQRPASCLKELVENSLDAGATQIKVIVVDAGRTLLQVIDNGTGMNSTDLRMAFERHATSKISQAEDLFDLHTMGFRGEALASICAVAHVEVQSRMADQEIGSYIEVAGSKIMLQESCSCSVGTSFKVKDLFFNVPARRKFLKTDKTELRNLLQDFYKIVLVYPHVAFTFVSQDEILMDMPAQSVRQRIEAVFGKSSAKPYTSHLVDLSVETEIVSIHGLIGKPENAGRHAEQYFFVNGRFMRHPYFHKAVMAAYANMLVGDVSPSYFIYFDVNPQSIDVNIHPTKTEIKFQDEQYIFQILMATIREALGKFNIVPSIDFDREGEVEMPVTPRPAQMPHIVVDSSYNPFHTRHNAPTQAWERLYTVPAAETSLFASETAEGQLFEDEVDNVPIFSYADKYLLMPASQGLLLIHPHRAQVAVLYHRLMEQLTQGQGVKQQVLFPEDLAMNDEEGVLFRSISKDLEQIGFEFEQYARNGYNISAVPANFGERSALPILKEILHIVREQGTKVTEQWHKRLALAMAKDMAIPVGKHLSDMESRNLVKQLFALSQYRRTEDGQVVVSLLTDEEIKKRF